VTGDDVYGADPTLRKRLHERGLGYVLAVARNHRVRTGIGQRRAIDLAVRLPGHAWQRLSAGHGAHGERWYDWTWIDIREKTAGCHGLLIRRNRASGEFAFYRTWTPHPVPLAELVRVAGIRWNVEEDFQTGKELTALDEHQVRRWTSWYRWVTLAMLAAAVLTIAAATEHAGNPAPAGLIPLTRNEIAHLLATVIIRPVHDPSHRLRWSRWRRRHQHRARTCHYKRQAAQDQAG
jgi:SRSO17 transposase